MRHLDLYRFFFTHKLQYVPNNSNLNNYLDVVLESDNSNFPLFSSDNVIKFVISNYQEDGEIFVYVDSGNSFLSASSSIKVNTDKLSIDSTIEPVSNYKASFTTPITSSNLKVQSLYSLSNTTYNFSYPYVYRHYNQKVTEKPWIIEYADYLVEGSQTVLGRISSDNNLVRIGDPYIKNELQKKQLTIDRVDFYYTNDSNVALDISPDNSSDLIVSLERVPQGNVIVEWKINNNIVSQISIPSLYRGYYPTSYISNLEAKEATLKEVSLSLIALVCDKQNFLIESVLVELIHRWGKNKDFFLKTSLELSWLGCALIKVVEYFRDRPRLEMVSLPNGFNNFLKDIVDKVCSLVDLGTGWMYSGLSNSHINAQISKSGTVICCLFLQQYLAISYSDRVHSIATKIFCTLVESEETPDEQYNLQEDKENYFLYRLFWKLSNKKNTNLDRLIEYLSIGYSHINLSEFDRGLWLWCIGKCETLGYTHALFSQQTANKYFIPVQKNIYSYSLGSSEGVYLQPTLVSSSWMKCISSQIELLSSLYNLYAIESNSYYSFMVAEARRMLPFGYGWFNEASEENDGQLGCLLNNNLKQTQDWSNQFLEFHNGHSISTSQGYILDLWAQTYSFLRPELQSDNYFKKIFLYYINFPRCTLSGIKDYLKAVYTEEIDVKEQIPLKYMHEGKLVNYTASLTDHTRINSGAAIEIEREIYPTKYKLANGNKKITTWVSEIPNLTVLIENTSDEFISGIRQETPCSCKVNIFSRKLTISFYRSFAYHA